MFFEKLIWTRNVQKISALMDILLENIRNLKFSTKFRKNMIKVYKTINTVDTVNTVLFHILVEENQNNDEATTLNCMNLL